MAASDAGSVTTDAPADDLEAAGYTIHEDAADAILAAQDLTGFEDMSSQHRRYRKRSRTQNACTLPAERGMPKSNATPEQWAEYHANHTTGTGGFDPCSLIHPRST